MNAAASICHECRPPIFIILVPCNYNDDDMVTPSQADENANMGSATKLTGKLTGSNKVAAASQLQSLPAIDSNANNLSSNHNLLPGRTAVLELLQVRRITGESAVFSSPLFYSPHCPLDQRSAGYQAVVHYVCQWLGRV